jgi:neutral ceramidase
MSIQNVRFLAVLAVLALGSPAGLADPDDSGAKGLQAGAATVDVTPPLGFAMWGYGARHDAPSVGVIDPLHARALVLQAGKEKIAIVGLDIGRAPTRGSMAAIRKRVKAETGIEHLFIVGSHTHHGPVIELDNWPTPETSYVRGLEKKLADVIALANQNLQPARLGIASKQVPYNRNRHSKRPDKSIDQGLLVLRVEGLDGKVIAHAVNFAAHPVMTVEKDMRFSADYPGAMAGVVESETHAPCLFLQGAAGDLSPNPPGQWEPIAFGQALGREVLSMAKGIKCQSEDKPSLQSAEQDFRFKTRVDLGNPLIKGVFVRAFFQELVDFYDREYREGSRPHLSVSLLNWRIVFVGVSGEFFCRHSLDLKRRARLDHLFFLGYCNDYQQYFPTIETAAEGGYGADPGVSNAEVGAGERMMDEALILLYRMRGKYKDMPWGK